MSKLQQYKVLQNSMIYIGSDVMQFCVLLISELYKHLKNN